MNKYRVSYWVEPKSYDDRPSNEYEDFVDVMAEDEDEAFKVVRSEKRIGKHRYDFKVVKL